MEVCNCEKIRKELDFTYDFPASGDSPNEITIPLDDDGLVSVQIGVIAEISANILIAEDGTERDAILGTSDPYEFVSGDLPVGYSRTFNRRNGKLVYIISTGVAVAKAILVLKKYNKV